VKPSLIKTIKKVEIQDLKIYALNGSAFTISFMDIETMLKIILLLVSIGYTIARWYEIHKNNK